MQTGSIWKYFFLFFFFFAPLPMCRTLNRCCHGARPRQRHHDDDSMSTWIIDGPRLTSSAPPWRSWTDQQKVQRFYHPSILPATFSQLFVIGRAGGKGRHVFVCVSVGLIIHHFSDTLTLWHTRGGWTAYKRSSKWIFMSIFYHYFPYWFFFLSSFLPVVFVLLPFGLMDIVAVVVGWVMVVVLVG